MVCSLNYHDLMFHSIHYNCSHSLARLKCLMLSKNGRCTHPNKSPRVYWVLEKFSPAQKGPKKIFSAQKVFQLSPILLMMSLFPKVISVGEWGLGSCGIYRSKWQFSNLDVQNLT